MLHWRLFQFNSPLILLQNLSPAHGLCNGTQMILTRTSTRVLEVKIIGGKHHGVELE